MKITHSTIQQCDSVKEAILESINESYSKAAIATFTELLVVNKNIGTCIEIEHESYGICTRTYLFVVTSVAHSLLRVDHVVASKTVFNNNET